MFVLICKRIVKVATGYTTKFAPRTTNQTSLHVSGPFLSLKAAQRAALTALSTHTCLDAQVWSEAQIRERHELRSYLDNYEANAIKDAMRLLSVK